MISHKSFLQEWFGIHNGREVGCPSRTFINRHEEFYEFFDYCEKFKQPCFMSVNPYRERDVVYGLEKLFFDFDSTDLRMVWEETLNFTKLLKNQYNIQPLITFSGRKGFHVYVFLWRTVEFKQQHRNLAKKVYGCLQKRLLEGCNYETLDKTVLGDIKRLSRVPYSTHQVTNKQCLPINEEGHRLTNISLYNLRTNGLSKSLFSEVVSEVKQKRRTVEVKKVKKSVKGIRPCILNAQNFSNVPHLIRLAIACEYLNNGYSVERVVDVFRNLPKFDEMRTRYQVEHAKNNEYKPFTCSRIMSLGFCLREKCRIYRNRTRYAIKKYGLIEA